MSRPGVIIRTIAARIFSDRTMGRVVDPVLADMQSEHAEATAQGRTARAQWIHLVGFASLAKTLVAYECVQSVAAVRGATAKQWLALVPAFASMGVATIAFATLVGAPGVIGTWAFAPSHSLALYTFGLGALTMSIPVGMFIGTSSALRASVSRFTRIACLCAALAGSIVTLEIVGHLLPEANQFYRVFTVGHEIPRGYGEFTLGELREAAAESTVVNYSRSVPAYLLHSRLAFAASPSVLMVLALVLSSRGPRRRLVRGPLAFGITLLYIFAISQAQREPSPVLAAWTPNILALLASLTIALILPTREPGDSRLAIPD